MRTRAYPTPGPLVPVTLQFSSSTVTYGVPAGQVEEFCRRVGVEAVCLSYQGWWLTGPLDDFRRAVDALIADTVPRSYYEQVLESRAARAVR
jgi:hypothetical protein